MEAAERRPAESSAGSVEEALALARRLQIVSERLAEARTAADVLDAVLGVGLEAAGARRGLIALLDRDGEALEIVASSGYLDETVTSWRRFPLVDELPLSRAVLQAEPIFLRSEQERDELFPALVGRSEHGHALACLPLIIEGRPLGGLVLSFAEDEEFSEERRRFKVALARQAAQALERTRLFEAERRLRQRMAFLAGAGYLLYSSLDYRETLGQVARLAVPELADWCTVDMLSEDRTRIERLAVAHVDPQMVHWAQELGDRHPQRLDAPHGVATVLRTREPEFIPAIDDTLLATASDGDEELLALLRRLDLRSAITVPLVARERALGALTLIRTAASPAYTDDDLELAVELSLRAAQAVDNALLLREVQREADAARALAYVADAVVMVDTAGTIEYWNAAAERLTGIPAAQVIGRTGDSIRAWQQVREQVAPREGAPVTVVPLTVAESERWVAVRAVGFGEGVVYALRDITADRQLEQLRAEFVTTASHELRTPLAAVYGAIRSLRRTDVEMEPEQQEQFLAMIETQTERLRALVDQLLIVGRLDADAVSIASHPVELAALVNELVQSTQLTTPDSITIQTEIAPNSVVVADRDLLRQVLANLLDNAIKYSPGGGTIEIGARSTPTGAQITIKDHGIGIPADLQPRIFEKFFRADPAQTAGISGTGLGLYIAAELTRRMHGQMRLESTPGAGSTFTVELAAA